MPGFPRHCISPLCSLTREGFLPGFQELLCPHQQESPWDLHSGCAGSSLLFLCPVSPCNCTFAFSLFIHSCAFSLCTLELSWCLATGIAKVVMF